MGGWRGVVWYGGFVPDFAISFFTRIQAWGGTAPPGTPPMSTDFFVYLAGDISASSVSSELTSGDTITPIDLESFTTETLSVPALGSVSTKVYKFTKTYPILAASLYSERLLFKFARGASWNIGIRAIHRNAYSPNIANTVQIFEGLAGVSFRIVTSGGTVRTAPDGPTGPITEMNWIMTTTPSIGENFNNFYDVGDAPPDSEFPILWTTLS